MSKPTAASERLLADILEDSLDATPMEMLRRAYRAGQVSAASEFARRGGSVKSDAKTAAVRENAKKGGWPKGRKRPKKSAQTTK